MKIWAKINILERQGEELGIKIDTISLTKNQIKELKQLKICKKYIGIKIKEIK